MLIRHETTVVRHEHMLIRHETTVVRHENGQSRHECNIVRHDISVCRHEMKICVMMIGVFSHAIHFVKSTWPLCTEYCCLAQFFNQSQELRDNKGETFAHYCGTQYGAHRLYTTDGKMPLRDHALLVVKWLAMDGVRLAGAHPPEIKGKFVDVNPQEWAAMFKLVHETDSQKMAKRADTAAKQHATLKLNPPLTHPDCVLMPEFHNEATSAKNKMRTNSVFDVRGDAVIIGDVLLGLFWAGDPVTMVLRLPRNKLVATKWFEYQDAAANHYDVPSVPNNHWEEIVQEGRWESTQSLHNKCYRAVGFVRIGFD